MAPAPLRIGIIATSSAVPRVELSMGARRLAAAGFHVQIHPHCEHQSLFFAGTDAQRASALIEFASRDDLDVLWCARGGYGVTRLLPLLDEMIASARIPSRKLLVGYSDVTALHEYVRTRWRWATLHAPMPATKAFLELPDEEWSPLLSLLRGQPLSVSPWSDRLQFLTPPPAEPIEAPLVGGNLTVWNCLTGTRYAPAVAGSILFLEDVDEAPYRIDRMLNQLLQAGQLKDLKAIILGDFTNCRDAAPMVLRQHDRDEKRPLRPTFGTEEVLTLIFEPLARRLRIPLARGLRCGHGDHHAPLPLGARYTLHPDGRLQLLDWNWSRRFEP